VTFYPTIDQVIAIHAELIARFGAPLGSGTVAGLSRLWRGPSPATTATSFRKRLRFGRASHRTIRLWTATSVSR